MNPRIHYTIDGKPYKAKSRGGRTKLDPRVKAVRRQITLPPFLDKAAENWEAVTGEKFSTWVQNKMLEVSIHTDTVYQ